MNTLPDPSAPCTAPLADAASPAPAPRARPRLNADYRWTVPKVHAFLAALAQSGQVAAAARSVGMSRQSAYALRARLDGPQFRAAFDGARKIGLRARAAASVRRSRWDGPGLAALDRLRAGASPAKDAAQADSWGPQADACAAQADTSPTQADAVPPKPTSLSPEQCDTRDIGPRRPRG